MTLSEVREHLKRNCLIKQDATMWQKVKCFFGFHVPRPYWDHFERYGFDLGSCRFCGTDIVAPCDKKWRHCPHNPYKK